MNYKYYVNDISEIGILLESNVKGNDMLSIVGKIVRNNLDINYKDFAKILCKVNRLGLKGISSRMFTRTKMEQRTILLT